KADFPLRTRLLRQSNAARRDIDSRHAKPATAQIDHVSPDPAAEIEDETSRRNGCRPLPHRRIRISAAPVTRVTVATASPYQLPAYALFGFISARHGFRVRI